MDAPLAPAVVLACAAFLSIGIYILCARSKLKCLDRLSGRFRRCVQRKLPKDDLSVDDIEGDENNSIPKVIYRPRLSDATHPHISLTGRGDIKEHSLEDDKEHSLEDEIYAELDFGNAEKSSRDSVCYMSMNEARGRTNWKSAHTNYPTPESLSCSNILPAKKPWLKQNMDDRSDHIYLVPPKPVPVATTFSTNDNMKSDSDSDSDYGYSRVSKRKVTIVPSRRKWSGCPEIVYGPIIFRPSQLDSESIKYGISQSVDDLFKDAWWKSTQSLADRLRDYDGTSRYYFPCDYSSHNNEMAFRTSLVCKMGTSDDRIQRRNSKLLLKEDMTRSYSYQDVKQPCLSFWSESVPGGLQLTAELRAPPPRPCTLPCYVNFKAAEAS